MHTHIWPRSLWCRCSVWPEGGAPVAITPSRASRSPLCTKRLKITHAVCTCTYELAIWHWNGWKLNFFFFFGPLRHLTCVCQQQRWIQVLGESCLLQTSFHQSRRRKQITTKLCQCGVVNAIYATEGTSYLLSSLSFRKKKLLPWHPYLILKPNKYGHCVG